MPSFAIGTTQTTIHNSTATVYRYAPTLAVGIAPPLDPEPPVVWAGVDAEVCIAADEDPAISGVSLRPWTIWADDGRIHVAVDLSMRHGAAVPLYPASRAMIPGSCVRGWLTFLRGADESITAIRYEANGDTDNAVRIWETGA